MIELRRNGILVFKQDTEDTFDINQIKEADNTESPFNGEMFQGISKTDFSDFFLQDFEGVKTFDLDTKEEFKAVETFVEEVDERDEYSSKRKQPEMLYEDELQLMKRYHSCVKQEGKTFSKEDFFLNYNTYKF